MLAPLKTLYETKRGKTLPLPPKLSRLYGRLRMPLTRSRPYVINNFVTTLDGIVSLNVKKHAGGGDISGFSDQDRMVMGLLRVIADVVIVGAGTLSVDRHHIWTAERIFPDLAHEYRRLRATLGNHAPPLNVIISGSGHVINLSSPVFASGEVSTLIVTTTVGAKLLHTKELPEAVEVCTVRSNVSTIHSRAILEQVGRRLQIGAGKLILVEGGPHLLGTFYAEDALDEQFLTLAPQIAGRDVGDQRLSLVMGRTFAPRHPLWGTLIDLRRGSSHLFLRYAFPRDIPMRPHDDGC